MVHATKGFLSKVCRNLSRRQCERIVRKVLTQENPPIMSYCKKFESRITEKTKEFGNNRYYGNSCKINRRFFQTNNYPVTQGRGGQKLTTTIYTW